MQFQATFHTHNLYVSYQNSWFLHNLMHLVQCHKKEMLNKASYEL